MSYKIVLGSRVDAMLRRQVRFIANVSIRRAELFTDAFEEVILQLKDNPYLFPVDMDEALPEGKYRKALFAKWYKALFWVDRDIVYLDAVCDCREDLNRVLVELQEKS